MDKEVAIKQGGFLFAINDHYLNHLIRLYKAFDGDIECCIVLGEIAHYNARNIFSELIEERMTPDEFTSKFRGSNAHSISLSTGIPRETVRRKLLKLIEMGYVQQDEKKQLRITYLPKIELEEFSNETKKLFIDLIDRLKKQDHL
jgi:DNA-binding transcriptional ArsR family regulator